MRPALSFAIWLLPVAAALAAPAIELPSALSQPAPVSLRVTGLSAHEAVRIETRRAIDAETVDVASAAFVADRHGVVDSRTMAPRDGSYATIDGAGLFWSALPQKRRPDDPAPATVSVTVATHAGVVAAATTRTGPDPDGLHVEAVAVFPGAVFYRPRDATRAPVIVVLGGSEGGSWAARHFAPLLAARGYAVLGLPYYAPPYAQETGLDGLPTTFTDIPVDRLLQVRAWLAARPDADASRFGVWGVSKGAEFALVAASRYPWIAAVVAVVPTDVVWEGWGKDDGVASSFAVEGRPLAWVPYVGMDAAMARAARGEPMGLRRVHDAGRQAHPDAVAAARIPLERYRGALLLVGGGRDAIWASADMARAATAARAAAGLRTTLQVFPEAGHGLAGPGTDPATPLVALGGSAAANAAARGAAWTATFALFDRALRPSKPTHGSAVPGDGQP